jgi:hypothetical protein
MIVSIKPTYDEIEFAVVEYARHLRLTDAKEFVHFVTQIGLTYNQAQDLLLR